MSIHLTTTKDGFPAKRVGHLVYAMLPSETPERGEFQIFQCWPARDPATLTKLDLRRSNEFVKGEDAFCDYLRPLMAHHSQLRTLNRQPIDGMISTPWGASQSRKRYAEGIESVSTSRHGGFMLDDERNQQVDELWRAEGGAYEEDAQWAIVAITFPKLFTDRELEFAYTSLKDWYPDEFAAITGQPVLETDSMVLRERAFKAENSDNLVVYSAIRLKTDRTKTICSAAIGGRGTDLKLPKTSYFLVDSNEYDAGLTANGFVIDEARHQPCNAQGEPIATVH